MMSRPTKLTRDLQQKIVSRIRRGAYPDVAAQAVWISAKTFHRWMERGARATRGIYRSLYEAVHRAESHAEIEITLRVRKAAKDSPMATLKLLERRFPERWSPYRKLQVVSDSAPEQHGLVVVTAEQLRALIGGGNSATEPPLDEAPDAGSVTEVSS